MTELSYYDQSGCLSTTVELKGLTHQVSSGCTWRSCCTLPGNRSRTWGEQGKCFWDPGKGKFSWVTWNFWQRLLLGDLSSHWCRCKEPARRLHMQWVGKSNMYMSIDYYEDEEHDDDTNDDLVSETEPFADWLGDIGGRLVWQLMIQVDRLSVKVRMFRWIQFNTLSIPNTWCTLRPLGHLVRKNVESFVWLISHLPEYISLTSLANSGWMSLTAEVSSPPKMIAVANAECMLHTIMIFLIVMLDAIVINMTNVRLYSAIYNCICNEMGSNLQNKVSVQSWRNRSKCRAAPFTCEEGTVLAGYSWSRRERRRS